MQRFDDHLYGLVRTASKETPHELSFPTADKWLGQSAPSLCIASFFRVGVITVLIGGLLLIPRLAEAGEREPDSRQTADSLSAAAIAFQLRHGAALSSSARPLPRDRWLARDKVKHVVFSGLWTLSTQYVLVNKANWSEPDALPASVASGATIGILKELYDASRPTRTASGKDLAADAVGIGLAVGVIVL